MQRDETVVRIALDITEMDKQQLRRRRRERWLNLIVYQFVFWGMIGSALVIWLTAMVGVMKLLGWMKRPTTHGNAKSVRDCLRSRQPSKT